MQHDFRPQSVYIFCLNENMVMWTGSTRPIVYDSIYGGEYIVVMNHKRKRYGSRKHDQTRVVTSYRIYGCVLRDTQ